MKKIEIKKRLKKFLLKREEIIFAYLYGSFLERNDYSDIDVGIYLDAQKIKDFFEYEINLYALMREELKEEVDIRVLNNAPTGFLFNVIKGEILFSRNDDLLTDFIEKVGIEYSEFHYLNKKYTEEIFK